MSAEPGSSRETAIVRPGARVLLLDRADRVLLFRAVGDFLDAGSLWVPPGGGLNPGESYEEAAVREVWEETGFRITLGPCVWHRRYAAPFNFGPFNGAWIDSHERYFVARVDNAAITTERWEQLERDTIVDHRWWSVAEIAAAPDEVFVPRRLAHLLPPLIAGEYPQVPPLLGA